VAEDLVGEEEGILPAGDPAGAIQGKPAAGYDAVQVRMKMQVLPPSVEHGEEADMRAEVSGLGGNGEQSFRSGLEQNRVNLSRVLKRQSADLLGKREDDVEIGNR
jgi:hypothetical protein